MLHFANQPDRFLNLFIDLSLEMEIDHLEADYESDEDKMWWFHPRIRAMFTPQELCALLRQLLKAHRSSKLYQLTEYHNLVLYDLLDLYVGAHNDEPEISAITHWCRLKPMRIDFDYVANCCFWDTDFLLEAEIYHGLGGEGRTEAGLGSDLFGVINGLKPHPSEVALVEENPGPMFVPLAPEGVCDPA